MIVTPIPFVEQQLPYNPKFIREPDISGPGNGGMGMGMGGGSMYGPGPVAAAASVLIPPSPGGQAGMSLGTVHDQVLTTDG
jgi:hypothetical protein